VLSRHRVAIFVHGCFWHRHDGCRLAYEPASNSAFWKAKFEGNVRRDSLVEKQLVDAGWRVLIVWECAVRDSASNPKALADRIVRWIATARTRGVVPGPRRS
jgi:DNA mismatch endonuclease (patch repair protein)